MTEVPRFLSVFQQLKSVVDDGPWSMATRAAVAVVEVLPAVEGAVVCFSQAEGMRVPVGVSDNHALLAEQLEYTVGEGPGHEALRRRRQVVAGADFAHRWPVFNDVLLYGTGYRAVRALPLPHEAAVDQRGVLLLMYGTAREADRLTENQRLDLAQLALLIGQALMVIPDPFTAPSGCDAGADRVARRAAVAQAVGMIMAAHHLSMPDAFAVLRGYAYARTELVDDAATNIVTHRVPVHILA
ncbi:ANTAR domain-containing protein [Nakamurella deserti]|uniref:ANTAR domain-containing protein n=1 Tax=Nakamurella deserti TaxID=2164074 RepID=UPI000DBE51EE|nr:ANTAR domain-containing protein [Nakamurella deserti]